MKLLWNLILFVLIWSMVRESLMLMALQSFQKEAAVVIMLGGAGILSTHIGRRA